MARHRSGKGAHGVLVPRVQLPRQGRRTPSRGALPLRSQRRHLQVPHPRLRRRRLEGAGVETRRGALRRMRRDRARGRGIRPRRRRPGPLRGRTAARKAVPRSAHAALASSMNGHLPPIRMGYVGCGFLAQKVHLPNLVALDETELIAIAEVRPQLGRRVQERLGIPRLYPSHRELAADAEVEAVAVSGHFCGQGEIAIDLLLAGKDVFLEKPMAVSVAQAERVLAAERESGRRLMVGYMKRYDDGNMLLKSMIEDGETRARLGPVSYIRLHDFSGNWLGGLDTAFDQTDEPAPEAPECTFPSWLPETFHERY